ncbi:hypothetical protein N7450_005596 [Penicillium hetheringtonii]|uniref:Mitochondrial intermembrane space import and assembly protein 40 n=1 Tax=Penicillium hetheringtonii TaxID=911720 RepID=A0AAD6DIR9_9EURO|nr:hypothetical protein N7450_005596 [Penicillium hetheringtonii]
MFRPAVRALARANVAPCGHGPVSRRLISTGPTKSRSWKNTIVRLGLAGGAIYYYNTSSAFSKEPSYPQSNPIRSRTSASAGSAAIDRISSPRDQCLPISILAKTQSDNADESSQTLDSITPKIREERAAARNVNVNPEQLEEEAGQQAAFNPETGEINWDCPCLGGMAHGPCGEEFKAAFSCFVYSEEEPKGIDCIEKFQGMQNCFRAHPDIYGAELEDEEAEAASEAASEAPAAAASEPQPTAADIDASSHPDEKRARAKEVNIEMKAEAEKGETAESEELVPKAAHDAEEKNQAVQN